ncbi:cupredoxin domain-containing protein [Halegenticoccus soli]|uniref:cupredoxin domain-containing protein n=1 Tax=Halegenticoccus soli TaxID=1985678 RepID=UPI000C6E43CB|nr:plastocyanin/azurin family copper-binding protein [Halegenticoccus soli]
MKRNESVSRRRFAQFVGGAAVVGLAGCTGDAPTADAGSDGTTTGRPTETTGQGTEPKETTTDGHGGSHESGGHGHGGAIEGPVERAEVTMLSSDDGEHFDPHVVWVETGGTVVWKLESGAHSTTAYHPNNDRPQRIPDGASAWDSGVLSESGATFERTFDAPGVYDYFCIPHESMGMIGSVIVGEPDTEGQPGLKPPQAEFSDEVSTKLERLNEMAKQALEGGGSAESGHRNETEHGHENETAGGHGNETAHGDENETEHGHESGNETEHGH